MFNALAWPVFPCCAASAYMILGKSLKSFATVTHLYKGNSNIFYLKMHSAMPILVAGAGDW